MAMASLTLPWRHTPHTDAADALGRAFPNDSTLPPWFCCCSSRFLLCIYFSICRPAAAKRWIQFADFERFLKIDFPFVTQQSPHISVNNELNFSMTAPCNSIPLMSQIMRLMGKNLSKWPICLFLSSLKRGLIVPNFSSCCHTLLIICNCSAIYGSVTNWSFTADLIRFFGPVYVLNVCACTCACYARTA